MPTETSRVVSLTRRSRGMRRRTPLRRPTLRAPDGPDRDPTSSGRSKRRCLHLVDTQSRSLSWQVTPHRTEGRAVVVSQVSPPASGAAQVKADNTITYSPQLRIHGHGLLPPTLSSEDAGGTAVGTVTVTVTSSENSVHVESMTRWPSLPRQELEAKPTVLVHDQLGQPWPARSCWVDCVPGVPTLTQSGASATAVHRASAGARTASRARSAHPSPLCDRSGLTGYEATILRRTRNAEGLHHEVSARASRLVVPRVGPAHTRRVCQAGIVGDILRHAKPSVHCGF